MKNFLLSLFFCIASFFATYYGLSEYFSTKNIFSETTTTPSKNSIEETEKEKPEEIEDNDTEEDDLDQVEEENETEEESYSINTNINKLETDLKAWKKYNKENIELSYEFLPIDTDDKVIEKEDFLAKLKTGLYIPLKVESEEFIYKLHKLTDKANKKIGKSVRSTSSIALHYFKKEGQNLPEFNFTDLNGNVFNKETTEGKIKVIKCWFINCVICVQEFPELNELYDRYESNENVVFLSLAFDKTDKLKAFLSKKEFRFPVIAEQKAYMTKKLELKQYPTHIIVDEDNNIVKMINNVDALIVTLDQLIGNDGFNTTDDAGDMEF